MAENVTKKEIAAENEASKAELENVKKELEQYKQAYQELNARYSKLFGLFANTIDYHIAGSQKQSNN